MKFTLESLQSIKRCNGIYALKKDSEIVYIGRSSNIYLRILEHIVDGVKDFDSISKVYFDDITVSEIIETFIIDMLKPEYNELIMDKFDYYCTLPNCCKKHESVVNYKSAVYATDFTIGDLRNGN